jgi:hypothetical protein
MHRPTVLRSALALLALAAIACGDGRLGDLSEGISRDSVDVVMGTNTPDHQESYLNRGVFWEVLYYAAPGKTADSTALRTMSPVVLADGKVSGWGWEFLETTAEANGFQLPPAAN